MKRASELSTMPAGRVVAIIQARMNSKRLPKKVLADICGKTMLERVVQRVGGAFRIDEVVVTTTIDSIDDAVANLCDELNIAVFRGDESDVLGRYVQAARAASADTIVRVSGDCPMADPALVDQAVAMFSTGDWDYVSNGRLASFPVGLDVEVISRSALEEADKCATHPDHREHVTLYINNKRSDIGCGTFRLGDIVHPADFSHLYWAVNTQQDLERVRWLISRLPERFGWLEALALSLRETGAPNDHANWVSRTPRTGRTVAIVQARMGSSRLPGKVLADLSGKPLLEHVLYRTQRAKTLDETIVATTTNQEDDAIVDYCRKHDVRVFRGDAHDVLQRYARASVFADASTIVRITGDCPMIDPFLIDHAVTLFRNGDWDYLSNSDHRTFPDGLDVEVFTRAALDAADKEARDPKHREHVTQYMRGKPTTSSNFRFRAGSFTYPADFSQLRWTVDTQKDLEVVRGLLARLPDNYCWLDALAIASRERKLPCDSQAGDS